MLLSIVALVDTAAVTLHKYLSTYLIVTRKIWGGGGAYARGSLFEINILHMDTTVLVLWWVGFDVRGFQSEKPPLFFERVCYGLGI